MAKISGLHLDFADVAILLSRVFAKLADRGPHRNPKVFYDPAISSEDALSYLDLSLRPNNTE
jgi:hypothetical protein